MKRPRPIAVTCAVEGLVDEAVVQRLLRHVGVTAGPVYGKKGKLYLQKKILAYNEAAKQELWLVLVDLDQSHGCAPDLLRNWLPHPIGSMCLRVAVRAVEAWLLADKQAFADRFSVPIGRVPQNPEDELDPKQTVVNLAARSRSRAVHEDMIPRPGSGRKVGPLYTGRLIEFVNQHWSPGKAADRSDSLRRCLNRLDTLIDSQFQ